ncbi:MAG: DUF58 domain-containing protein [Prevotella sp.]|nr:DUF58 domain-containing protein [Prevotella sp.]MCF0208258.1 DUF58 domain-containing protein [Bacteroidaceae bacterium]
MNSQELLSKVRKLDIKARGLSKNIFAGQYHSAFKGRGMVFSEVREYQYGDDIRDIDWNVTARFNHPFVKLFEEERELTVFLLVDVSGSQNFGLHGQRQKDITTEIAATIAFSAIENNDKIGVIFFSDKIEKVIPAKKGRKHILHIIREMLDFEPQSKKTDVSVALESLSRLVKGRSTTFLLSDFYTQSNFEKALNISGKKHDVIAIQVYDKYQEQLPDVGLIKVMDAESGKESYLDTSSREVRSAHSVAWKNKQAMLADMFNKAKVDNISVSTTDDYVVALTRLFKQRAK